MDMSDKVTIILTYNADLADTEKWINLRFLVVLLSFLSYDNGFTPNEEQTSSQQVVFLRLYSHST